MSSEAGIGWIFLKRAAEVARARGIRVNALMNGRSAEATVPELERLGLTPWVTVTAIDIPPYASVLFNPKLTRIEYVWWVRCAAKQIRRSALDRSTVLGLHVTFATEVLPTPLGALGDRALKVWGPVGSSGSWRAFVASPREPGWARDALAQVLRNFASASLAGIHARNVDLVLAQTDRVAAQCERVGLQTRVFPNVVIPDALYPSPATPHVRRDEGLVLLSAGHLTGRKRLALTMSALTDPSLSSASLWIAGAPLPRTRDHLRSIAIRLGVEDRVHFLGKLNRDELLRRMAEADVYVHLSAREGASGAVGEATAVGLPVVCLAAVGSSAVARTAEAAHVALPDTALDPKSIAGGIVLAGKLQRTPYPNWTEARIANLVAELLDESGARKGGD
ncbi:glycosyltransferase [Microbacterium hominis]|uniref:D-inositol 3-phosphate glycosyltransferase n=1 Tax=Microbacterium hominis TaxID=162426 RepID=A0A7D4U5N7_9MICO|nr:glycosyltransferase [Microbacterium hominis]QKJ20245.1 glycosyltransferase [Microbacterium hominis]